MKKVTFSGLSEIKLEMFVAEHQSYIPPKYLYLKYKGIYQVGSLGSDDALYIIATAKAAFEAWYSDAIIIDFSELNYKWGDNMEKIFELSWSPITRCHHPLSIIVGENCKDSLLSLSKESFEETCVNSFEEALTMINKKCKIYDECLKNWRNK